MSRDLGGVVGNVVIFGGSGEREVGYWISRECWGMGLATGALREFLARVGGSRQIHARAAKDNAASLRVLKKRGFEVCGFPARAVRK